MSTLFKTGTIWFLFVLGLGLLCCVSWFFPWISTPEGFRLNAWEVQNDEVSLPYYRVLDSSQIVTLYTSFPQIEADCLFLPKISGHGFRVWLNGVKIGQLGAEANWTANVWSSSHLIPFDPALLKAENYIQIDLFGLYDAGIGLAPTVGKMENMVGAADFINFFSQDLSLIIIGACFLLGVILLVIRRYLLIRGQSFLYIGLASLLAAFYLFDFIFRYSGGNLSNFLWLRKSFLGCGYLANFFFLWGTEELVKEKHKTSWLLLILSLAAVTILLVQPSHVALKQYVRWGTLLIFPNLLLAFYLIISHREWNLLFPWMFYLIGFFHLAISMLLEISGFFFVPSAILLAAVGFSFFLVDEYKTINQRLNSVQQELLVDSLTGIHNRGILARTIFVPGDLVIMLDIDYFKNFNDARGHQAGDDLLKEFARAFREQLRKDDLFLRFGGDEFLLILKQGDKELVENIVNRVETRVRLLVGDETLSVSFGSAKLERSFEEALIQADEAMYHMKGKRKLEV